MQDKIDPKPQKPSLILKTKRRLVKWLPRFKKTALFTLFIIISYFIIQLIPPLGKLSQKIFFGPKIFFSTIFNLGPLKDENGRTNFLILGISGGNHEGPNLTDSIMFVSINPKTKDTLLLSIPRDIWIDSLKQKINAAYALGEAKKKGGGLILAKAAVSEIIGQPVHYALVIDFNAFRQAIDLVGGVDVYAERTFDDFKYPKEDKKWETAATESGDIYEHLHFKKGWQHMDGATALKFARSRNSEDETEGTDFARSKRQQKIILAFKDKLFSHQTFLDIPKLVKTAKTFQTNIDTDIKEENFPKLARLALKFNEKKLRSVVLDEDTKEKPGFLENPPIGEYGAWVLVPRTRSWNDFQNFLKKELEKGQK